MNLPTTSRITLHSISLNTKQAKACTTTTTMLVSGMIVVFGLYL